MWDFLEKKGKKMQKGQKGYLNAYKKRELIKAIIALAIIAAIVATALIVKHTTKTVIIVAAIVGALPAAKVIVGLILVIGYRSYDGLRISKELQQKGTELFDLAISTEENITFFPYMYMTQDKIFALVKPGKSFEKKKMQRYIQNWLKGEDLYFKVAIFEDEKAMIKEAESEMTRKKDAPEKKTNNDLEKAKERLLVLAL